MVSRAWSESFQGHGFSFGNEPAIVEWMKDWEIWVLPNPKHWPETASIEMHCFHVRLSLSRGKRSESFWKECAWNSTIQQFQHPPNRWTDQASKWTKFETMTQNPHHVKGTAVGLSLTPKSHPIFTRQATISRELFSWEAAQWGISWSWIRVWKWTNYWFNSSPNNQMEMRFEFYQVWNTDPRLLQSRVSVARFL